MSRATEGFSAITATLPDSEPDISYQFNGSNSMPPRPDDLRFGADEAPSDPHVPFHNAGEILLRLGHIVVVEMPVAHSVGDRIEAQFGLVVLVAWRWLRRKRLGLRQPP